MDRATADYMGMLAIVLNALTLQDALEKRGVHTRVQSAITISEVAEPYIRRRAMRHLEKKRIVIFAAGTGNPFFTSDTAAALRGDRDARRGAADGQERRRGRSTPPTRARTRTPSSSRRSRAREALQRDLKVMDSTALALCMENKLNIHVFNMADDSNINRIISGDRVGTLVTT